MLIKSHNFRISNEFRPQATATGVYFDAATGTFRQHAPPAVAAAKDSGRTGRRKQDLSRELLNDICRHKCH